jgi:hypothetical protein
VNTRNIIIFLQILILHFSLLGCINSKAKSCQQIIKVTSEVEKNAKDNLTNQNLNNILKVADSFDDAGQKILQEKIKDQTLAEYGKNLGQIYLDYGKNTRNFVEAFKNKDQEKAILYQAEISSLFTKQQQLVTQINNYCN